MKEIIKNFPKQFVWKPVIKNWKLEIGNWKFIVVGMGGSHLAADLVQSWNPLKNILIHKDYGLPPLSKKGEAERLIILSSYSGNTEEVINAFQEAQKRNLPMAVITVGGQLLDLAKENKIPYIQLPDMGLQPRLALGFNLKALLKIMGEEKLLIEISSLADLLKSADYEQEGKKLAQKLKNKIPIIYATTRNYSIAYNWKIKFNENGKIPAFCNVVPELNHNEMTGFDVRPTTKNLSKNFHFIFLRDLEKDHPSNVKRMTIMEKLFLEKKLPVVTLDLTGKNFFHKAFSSLILADWTSYYVAEQYGLDAEAIPMIDKFKKLISNG